MLDAELKLALYQRSMEQQVALRGRVEEVLDLAQLKTTARELEARHAEALSRQANPPHTASVRDAEEQLAKAKTTSARAETALKVAQHRLQVIELMTQDRDPLHRAAALASAQSLVSKARTAFNAATAAIDNAEAYLAQAKAAQDKALGEAVLSAQEVLDSQVLKVSEAQRKLQVESDRIKQMSDAANAPNFITQVTILMRLAARDRTVAITAVATLLAFLMLDLVPLLLKLAARGGAYARLAADEDSVRIAQSSSDAQVREEECSQLLAVKSNQTKGVRLYAEHDAGVFDCELLRSQRECEASAEAIDARLVHLETVIARVGAIEARIAQQPRGGEPQLAAVFREQLIHLLAELERLARGARAVPGSGTS
jgi:hypothetical protein